MKFGFIGPTYTSQAIAVDGERCINLYPEIVEGRKRGLEPNETPLVLYGTPGLTAPFITLPKSPIQALWSGENRVFAVAGGHLYEVFPNSTYKDFGSVSSVSPGGTNTPAQIFSNGAQLFIVNNGYGYLADGVSITPVVPAVTGGFMDGYFFAQQPNSTYFRFSAVLDGTSWDPLDQESKSGSPDNLVGMFIDHQEIWLMGEQSIEVWWDTGDLNNPFQRIQGAFIEQGCLAAFSIQKLDNSIFWLGGDSRGAGIVWRMMGYTPVRVSNHAIENILQQNAANLPSATAFDYQENGHSFYVLIVPGAKTALVYDAATKMWHERGYWNLLTGDYTLPLQGCHVYQFGRHLVGDRLSGNIYQQSLLVYTDNTRLIKRRRSAPAITNELKWYTYSRLVVDMQVGIEPGTLLDGSGKVRPPQAMLRISDDGGYTYGNELTESTGSIGQIYHRVRWDRLGRSRNRAFDWSMTDPIDIALVDAYLDSQKGIS